MKTFSLVNDEKEIVFKFPTSLEEITEDYLKRVTEQVHVADWHVLIGLMYRETIGRLIIARKQSKKGITSGVVPIFVKAAEINNDFIKSAKVKDKLIIPSSQISLANHVIAPKNTLSIDCFIKYLDKDTTVAARYSNNYGNEDCYLVEFKLIPANDIVGFYSNNSVNYKSPYLEIKDIDSNENSGEN